MSSAVLAALVLGNVPLFLYPQSHLADVRWPTHAAVAVPQGFIKPNEQVYLAEDDRPALAQVEVVARWPDGTPKWLHAYALFRYAGGNPARYALIKQAPPLPAAPASPLKVVDTPQAVEIDTGVVKFQIARPFAGITRLEHQGQVVIDGAGGPALVDDRMIPWQAVDDEEAEVVVEQQGPAQVVVRAMGWYQNPERRQMPFCRFTTRITAFANSPLLKFDHATTFAGDMRRHAISELSFKFAVPGIQRYSTGASAATGAARGAPAGGLSGTLGDAQNGQWFAQLSANQMLALAQRGADNPEDVSQAGAHGRSAGWFAADTTQRRLTLLTKDFWQKYPKEVKIGRDEVTFYSWPRHGHLGPRDPAPTRLEEVYKFQCFLTGRLLDPRLPSEYFSALELQTDTTECKAQYARAASMEGVSLRNEFALLCLPATPADSAAADRQVAAWQRLFIDSPMARVSPVAMAASGALGPVSASSGSDFRDIDRVVRNGMLGYAHSIDRYGDYGWSIYGNTHHAELMNPTAAGTPLGRPSLHRVWSNNHYQHVSTSWRLFALNGDARLLDWARTSTDNYGSIGQVRYDGLRGRTDGRGMHHPGPAVKFHNPGAFYHCKGLVPWGARDFGMDSNDTDSGLIGHWPDPSSLLLAWLIDADRWAKDGYDLWRKEVKLPRTGARREINTTLVHAITAYEYEPNEATLASIKGMATGLRSMPILEQRPGPLWEPTWLSRYHELVPDDEDFNKYIITSADSVGVMAENMLSLALSATAYRITQDEKYLRQHAGTLSRAARSLFQDPVADKRWDQYGFAPGPGRDRQFMLQWHRFRAALLEAKITSLPAPEEPGQYFCGVSRFDNRDDIHARGTKVLLWRDQPSAAELAIQASTLSGGDIAASSLEVLSPAGQPVLDVKRMAISSSRPTRVTRPSTWEAAVERHPLPAGPAGLYTALFGSNQIGVFQGISGGRECQVLRNSRLRNRGEGCFHEVKLTRGFLVPLASGPLQLTFTALGTQDGGYVGITGAKQEKIIDRYLRSGESVQVTLNERSGPASPWLLDLYCDHSGFLRMSVTGSTDEPALYGHKLEDVQFIRQRLAAPNAGRGR